MFRIFIATAVLIAAISTSANASETTTRLSVTPRDSFIGKPVTLKARVSSSDSQPFDGRVSFRNGNQELHATKLTTVDGRAIQIKGNVSHACVISKSKKVLCWDSGRTSLQPVEGLADVEKLAVGDKESCAVTARRKVWCWENRTDRLVPALVLKLSNVVAIAVGSSHACAVTVSGRVACWGNNEHGQLGRRDVLFAPTPEFVEGLVGATAISAGHQHTCAIAAGRVRCWGDNSEAQLGVGHQDPVTGLAVLNIDAAQSVTASGLFHTCAIVNEGRVQCWGNPVASNPYTARYHLEPSAISGLVGAKSLARGHHYICARLSSNQINCWQPRYARPYKISGLGDNQGLSYTPTGFCTLEADGRVSCWLPPISSVDPVNPKWLELYYGEATLETTSLPVGQNALQAVFLGSTDHAGSVSNVVNHLVTDKRTSISLTASATTSDFSEEFTLTATVQSPHGTPTGSVRFYTSRWKRQIGTGVLDTDGRTTVTTSAPIGTNAIYATYESQDGFYRSTSARILHTVKKLPVTMTVDRPNRRIMFGARASFDVKLTSSSLLPERLRGRGVKGQLTLYHRGKRVQQRRVGKGELSRPLFYRPISVGRHRLRAIFDSYEFERTTAVLTVDVVKASTETQLSSSHSVFTPGQAVTLSAQVVPKINAAMRGGRVYFLAGGKELGWGQVTKAGRASLTTDEIPVGKHEIVAEYRGSKQHAASISPPITVEVSPKVGPEFQVNTLTVGHQEQPAAAALTNGGHVVVWSSIGQDGAESGIFGQRYDLSGQPIGTQFRVNASTEGDQSQPAVVSTKDGGFVVVWSSSSAKDLSGIMMQRFGPTGGKAGEEIEIEEISAGLRGNPSVAELDDTNIVVVWHERAEDLPIAVVARIYDPSGAAVGDKLRFSTTVDEKQMAPSVIATRTGFAVAWRQISPDPQDTDATNQALLAQEFTALGTSAGSVRRVDDVFSRDVSSPVMLRLPNDAIFFAYAELHNGDYNVVGRLFQAGLQSASHYPSFIMNKDLKGMQAQPALTALPSGQGDFLASWISHDGSDFGVFVQRFDKDARRQSEQDIQLNTFSTGNQVQPVLAPVTPNGALAAWVSAKQDGSGRGVFGQRLQFEQPQP